MSFAEVCVSLPAGRRQLFTYCIPPGMKVVPGSGVWVPFGARVTQGIVVRLAEVTAVEAVRSLTGLIQVEPVLSPVQLDLACWVAEYYLSPLFDALALFLPPGFVRSVEARLSLTEGYRNCDDTLSADGLRVACLLKEKGELALNVLEKAVGKGVAGRGVPDLLNRGYAAKTFEAAPPRVRPKTEFYVGLAPAQSSEAPVLKRSPRREALFNYLREQSEAVPLSQLRAVGFSRNTVKALAETGAVVTEERAVIRRPFISGDMAPDEPRHPTPAQARAITAINDSLAAGRSDIFLLHGVTGSGKTEVYLQALAQAVRLGKQGIVLVPEIALTSQTAEHFASRFPGKVAVLHSGLSLGEQYDTWHDIRNGVYDVVVGARSAVFAPLLRLGLIVVDEEHEWTYKQDRTPCYHARTVALRLAALNGAVVVLGSATPDVESYYLAETGVYRLLELPERLTPYHGAPLPAVQVIDLRIELKAGNRSIFSSALQDGIRRALVLDEQIILFFNRRGSATMVQCRTCGHTVACPSCSIALNHHSAEEILVCHQCGRKRLVPKKCPICGSQRIRYLGLGTQKVTEEAAIFFPAARLLRWDSDAARGKNAHADILAKMRRHEADMLIGTQLVAKGLDLPLVTLVGVVSADTSLGLPDFRAGERTFQLLTQVAGRPGRGARPGHVIVQTYTPEHYAIQAAATHDYKGFYKREIEYRHALGNSPFSQLVRFTCTHVNDAQCFKRAENLKKRFAVEIQAQGLDVKIVGPAPAFVTRTHGRYRWQLMLKGSGLMEMLRKLEMPGGWLVDVDPVGL